MFFSNTKNYFFFSVRILRHLVDREAVNRSIVNRLVRNQNSIFLRVAVRRGSLSICCGMLNGPVNSAQKWAENKEFHYVNGGIIGCFVSAQFIRTWDVTRHNSCRLADPGGQPFFTSKQASCTH